MIGIHGIPETADYKEKLFEIQSRNTSSKKKRTLGDFGEDFIEGEQLSLTDLEAQENEK